MPQWTQCFMGGLQIGTNNGSLLGWDQIVNGHVVLSGVCAKVRENAFQVPVVAVWVFVPRNVTNRIVDHSSVNVGLGQSVNIFQSDQNVCHVTNSKWAGWWKCIWLQCNDGLCKCIPRNIKLNFCFSDDLIGWKLTKIKNNSKKSNKWLPLVIAPWFTDDSMNIVIPNHNLFSGELNALKRDED